MKISVNRSILQYVHFRKDKHPREFLAALLVHFCESPLPQSGIKCIIVASAMRAEQGPCEPIKGCIRKLESNSEPERARVCQRVAVRARARARARVGVTGSHREPERDRERSSRSQR